MNKYSYQQGIPGVGQLVFSGEGLTVLPFSTVIKLKSEEEKYV
jgi:hypothetical protein